MLIKKEKQNKNEKKNLKTQPNKTKQQQPQKKPPKTGGKRISASSLGEKKQMLAKK